VRRRRLVLFATLLVIVAAAASTVAATRTGGTPMPLGVPGSWKLIFADNFSRETSLDTSKWSTGWYGSGITAPIEPSDLNCFDARRVSVGRGALHLSLAATPEACAGKTRPFAGAIITTRGKFSYAYGFAEIRAKVAVNPAGLVYDWPVFWTVGQNWPTGGEDDIIEGIDGYLCWHFHSPAGGPGGCNEVPVKPGWHTYGSDWQPGSVTYYYDGRVVGTITTGITGAPMYMILNIGVGQYGDPIRPATFRVAFVRVWQHP